MPTYRRASKTKFNKLRERKKLRQLRDPGEPANLRKIRKASRGRLIHVREAELKALIREGAHAGLVAAIEHTHNFWQISDGYKQYIDHQITSQVDALMAAVKVALRQELDAQKIRQQARKQPRRKPS
jgi:hypothetical protein